MKRLVLLVVVMCLPYTILGQSTVNATDIMIAADQYRGEDSWGFSLQVIELQKGEHDKIVTSESFEVAGGLFGPSKMLKAFVQSTAPQSEVGKKMLMDGRIYWVLFPRTQNLIRITPDQRLVGSAAAADIASTNFSCDYDGTVLGEEQVLQRSCYKLALSRKREEAAYATLNYWVEKDSFKPVKVEYFSITGKLLKTAYFQKFQVAPAIGKIKTHEIIMLDAEKEGRITRMLYDNLRPEKRPDYFFDKDKMATLELTIPQTEPVTPEHLVKSAERYLLSSSDAGFVMKIIDMQKGKEAKILGTYDFSGAVRMFGQGNDAVCKFMGEFTEPKSEAGKKVLLDGSKFWLSFPNTQKFIELATSQRLAGLATAADIAGLGFASDYTAAYANPAEEPLLGRLCYKLILTARPEREVSAPRLHYWIDKENFQPVRVDYFAVTGEVTKTIYYRDFKMVPVLNQTRAHEVFILVPAQEDRATRLFYLNFRAEQMPESAFQK